jgi:hypothetical protein
MNKADGQATANRLSAIVANSLDTEAKTQDLASPSVPKPHAVPEIVPNSGRRNSGSHATSAIVGTGSYINCFIPDCRSRTNGLKFTNPPSASPLTKDEPCSDDPMMDSMPPRPVTPVRF